MAKKRKTKKSKAKHWWEGPKSKKAKAKPKKAVKRKAKKVSKAKQTEMLLSTLKNVYAGMVRRGGRDRPDTMSLAQQIEQLEGKK